MSAKASMPPPNLHPEMGVPDGAHGKASISVDGIVKNSGVPAKVTATATDWIVGNQVTVQAEWTKMNNPRKR